MKTRIELSTEVCLGKRNRDMGQELEGAMGLEQGFALFIFLKASDVKTHFHASGNDPECERGENT